MERITNNPDLDRLEVLFDANVDAVFNVAQRILWNRADAEDVVQTTFLKAITRLEQLRDDDRARPWLLQISYREAIAVLRRRRDRPTDPQMLPDAADVGAGPEDAAIATDMARILSAALRQLAESERLAVTLRDVENLPMRDVADIMGIGLSAAKMRVHRGRAALRTTLPEGLGHAV